MSRLIRVAYWNNIPSPYFTERLSTIAATGQVDMHGIFNSERNPDRSWDVDSTEWQFDSHWAHRSRGTIFDASPVVRALKPDLLVSLYGEPSFAINGPRAARHSGRWAIRVVPTFDAWQPRSAFKELVKRGLGRLVDSAKVPGPDGRAYAESLGVPADRVFEVQQSIPVEHFQTAAGRESAREHLGISQSDFVFVYVGRLWEGKGLQVLLEAAAKLPRDRPWSLLLVGDGPMGDELSRRQDLPIKLAGFVQRSELPSVLAAADCLVFPTLGDPFGLVVEECMAAGLPVVTSDQMGDARARVSATNAGIVVDDHTAQAWAESMALMLNPANHAKWQEGALARSQHVGHDAYVRDFLAFVFGTLALPPRRPHLRSAKLAGPDGA